MALKRLSGKFAIVTGSSSGLGRAIALGCARAGAAVACADLQAQAKASEPGPDTKVNTHDLINRGGGKAIYVQTDVVNSQQMQNLVTKAADAFGRVDVMVNNAGIGTVPRPAKPHEMEDDLWDKIITVNTRSAFLGCKHAITQMLEQEPHVSGHRGWIVNVSSALSTVAIRGCPASYTASKGAVSALTRQIALDYAENKIHCNAICPGVMRTPMVLDSMKDSDVAAGMADHFNSLHPFGGISDAATVAKTAVMLASDDADWLTGVNLPIDGGYTIQ